MSDFDFLILMAFIIFILASFSLGLLFIRILSRIGISKGLFTIVYSFIYIIYYK